MRKLTIGSEHFGVPENFGECNIDQISGVLVAQQALNVAKEYKNEDKIDKVKLSILFCLIPDLSMDGWKLLTNWQKTQVMCLIRWAFTARVEKKPFEWFGFGRDAAHSAQPPVKYYLPAEDYADTCAIEWALLNIYYLAYTKPNIAANRRQTSEFFFKIVALLCRPQRADLVEFRKNPKAWNGDVREPFNGALADEREEIFRNVPFGILLAVFQYWEKMNNDFVTRNEELFNGADGKPLFQNGEGCLSMLEDVAEEGTMGDLDKVHDSNVVNLFIYLRHKQKKVERREEEMLKNQSNDSR
jgi:hypothetical protein